MLRKNGPTLAQLVALELALKKMNTKRKPCEIREEAAATLAKLEAFKRRIPMKQIVQAGRRAEKEQRREADPLSTRLVEQRGEADWLAKPEEVRLVWELNQMEREELHGIHVRQELKDDMMIQFIYTQAKDGRQTRTRSAAQSLWFDAHHRDPWGDLNATALALKWSREIDDKIAFVERCEAKKIPDAEDPTKLYEKAIAEQKLHDELKIECPRCTAEYVPGGQYVKHIPPGVCPGCRLPSPALSNNDL